ncbi:hypothetical protein SAMN05444339_11518 [Loktanella atrilutea]|uniref:Uncharacterized protein n=1 Tax=Loktanella atrilutea TaxID=366533 RepID=A0A1M5EVK5_LOKAT|nr:hypothetical protein SAMN05444339_11518 [Loktanella atrilutea]
MSSAGRPGRKPFWSIRGMHLQSINVVELAEVSVSRIHCCATRTQSHGPLHAPDAPSPRHCRRIERTRRVSDPEERRDFGRYPLLRRAFRYMGNLLLRTHLPSAVLQMADVSYGTRSCLTSVRAISRIARASGRQMNKTTVPRTGHIPMSLHSRDLAWSRPSPSCNRALKQGATWPICDIAGQPQTCLARLADTLMARLVAEAGHLVCRAR